MLLVILAYDQLLFRPLVAWSPKFRFETTAGATASDPWLLRLMRRTRLLNRLGDAIGDAAVAIGGLRLRLGRRTAAPAQEQSLAHCRRHLAAGARRHRGVGAHHISSRSSLAN